MTWYRVPVEKQTRLQLENLQTIHRYPQAISSHFYIRWYNTDNLTRQGSPTCDITKKDERIQLEIQHREIHGNKKAISAVRHPDVCRRSPRVAYGASKHARWFYILKRASFLAKSGLVNQVGHSVILHPEMWCFSRKEWLGRPNIDIQWFDILMCAACLLAKSGLKYHSVTGYVQHCWQIQLPSLAQYPTAVQGWAGAMLSMFAEDQIEPRIAATVLIWKRLSRHNQPVLRLRGAVTGKTSTPVQPKVCVTLLPISLYITTWLEKDSRRQTYKAIIVYTDSLNDLAPDCLDSKYKDRIAQPLLTCLVTPNANSLSHSPK